MFASYEKALSISLPKVWRMYSSAAYKTAKKPKFNSKHPASIKPVRVQNVNRKTVSKSAKESVRAQEFPREFKREMELFGDPNNEPDPGMFSEAFDTYLEEKEDLKNRIKKQKMARKHFKDIMPKEISVLTWAEKENIRYLCETEPDQWTPEAISDAYPISPGGVEKLLKSTLRLKTANEVKRHDQIVAEKIRRLKSGERPMSEELAKRLKIRDLIPLKVGDLGMYGNEIFVRTDPDVNGAFASLVAPPVKKKEAEVNVKQEAVRNYSFSDGELIDPSQSPIDGKPVMNARELKKILPVNKRMTFDEFEARMTNKRDKLSKDMKYMLTLNENKESAKANENKPNAEDVKTSMGYSNDTFPSKQSRYKVQSETDKVEICVEGGDAYIHHPDTGTQRPYTSKSSSVVERIEIPEDMYQPGATYRVNDCYYDDQGEFLYRVL